MRFDSSVDKCRRRKMTMFFRVLIACEYPDPGVAARELAAAGVPFDVARRVILFPSRRRAAK